MEKLALKLDDVTKHYKDFTLDNISFSVPEGSIVGLIGENGAGKSTTINSILGLTKKDSGTITMLGSSNIDEVSKDEIGVVFDGNNYPDVLNPKQLGKVFANIYIQDEEHSVLVSSHITSDLEKIADYIVFIHEGKIIFSKSKDELLEKYGIIKCGAAQFDALDKEEIIAYRKQDYEWQVLVADRQKAEKKYPKAMVIPANIDEIMLMYVKGAN